MTLKMLRGAKGFTQEYVSEKLEVTQTVVSFWERGKGSPLKKNQKKLADLYGVTIEEVEQAIRETSAYAEAKKRH